MGEDIWVKRMAPREKKFRKSLFLKVAFSVAFVAGCAPGEGKRAADAPLCQAASLGEVMIPGGAFNFGANARHPEEGPATRMTIAPFAMDATEVTNDQFAAFVKATGYVTQAERAPDPKDYPGVPADALKPSSIVFVGLDGAPGNQADGVVWRVIEGANWREPQGPGSTIDGKGAYPVVQVSWEDASAYARWAGRALPSEAEWEFAARGGLVDKPYVWGDEKPTAEAPRANHWQGLFPLMDQADDGYKAQTAPVGCFAANGYGLYDMAGNVWEWTADWYKPNLSAGAGPRESDSFDPREPGVAKHVIKGGSFLCADNYCVRYRPPAREAGPPDTGTSHIGFRTIRRLSEKP